MKMKIYFSLLFMLSAILGHGEVLTATSEPFTFGATAVPVPLSILAMTIFAGSVLVYSFFRFVGIKKKAD